VSIGEVGESLETEEGIESVPINRNRSRKRLGKLNTFLQKCGDIQVVLCLGAILNHLDLGGGEVQQGSHKQAWTFGQLRVSYSPKAQSAEERYLDRSLPLDKRHQSIRR